MNCVAGERLKLIKRFRSKIRDLIRAGTGLCRPIHCIQSFTCTSCSAEMEMLDAMEKKEKLKFWHNNLQSKKRLMLDMNRY
jgi:hypothetical protein